jgi:hypothetical protein
MMLKTIMLKCAAVAAGPLCMGAEMWTGRIGLFSFASLGAIFAWQKSRSPTASSWMQHLPVQAVLAGLGLGIGGVGGFMWFYLVMGFFAQAWDGMLRSRFVSRFLSHDTRNMLTGLGLMSIQLLLFAPDVALSTVLYRSVPVDVKVASA